MRKFLILLFLYMLGISSMKAISGEVKQTESISDNSNLLAITQRVQEDAVFQISTYDAFTKGCYKSSENRVSAGKKFGRFGYGVLQEGTGALVFNGDDVWKIKDFKMETTGEEEYIPIAYGMFKKFKTDDRITLKNINTFSDFSKQLDEKLETVNYFVAIRAKGSFKRLILQTENSERKVVENTKGTLIGFRVPDFYGKLSNTGYTLYYIGDDKLIAGKVYELDASIISFYVDYSNRIELILPRDKTFKVKDFAQYEPIENKTVTSDKKQPENKDLQKVIKQGNGEPNPEDMMQMFAPKMSF